MWSRYLCPVIQYILVENYEKTVYSDRINRYLRNAVKLRLIQCILYKSWSRRRGDRRVQMPLTIATWKRSVAPIVTSYSEPMLKRVAVVDGHLKRGSTKQRVGPDPQARPCHRPLRIEPGITQVCILRISRTNPAK